MKKVFGYIFLVIGGLLALSFLIRLPKLASHFFYLLGILQETGMESFIVKPILAYAVVFIIYLGLIITFLWLGRKWTKKAPVSDQNILDQ